MLTEAAMAGAQDTLIGLKENVILGHLIPAGTGYAAHQKIRVKHLVEGGEAPAFARENRETRDRGPRGDRADRGAPAGRLTGQLVPSSPRPLA